MARCKRCNAETSENARFCYQCGDPLIPDGPTRPQGERELNFVLPALTGGMFLGLLSSLPFINAGNCICCMWVLGGGAIATFLLVKQQPAGVSYGDGAFAGVLSGLFGAIVATMVSIPLRLIFASMLESQQRALEEALRDMPGLEGPLQDLFLRLASPEISLVTIAFSFFTNLLVFALFAMIGGILMVAILNKRGASSTSRP